jgi:glyoxylate carboligase
MKGSDLLVAALENEGVEQIFGVPGEENLDVVESLRRSRIKLIVTRHEQAAAFMAATHGRLTGKPGVCLGSSFSNEISLGFILGNTWSNKMSNPKRIGLKERARAPS